MKIEEVYVGMGVVYRSPHPHALPEDGIVTTVRDGRVYVRYAVMGDGKLTPVELLEKM